jgi:hypothetical protein
MTLPPFCISLYGSLSFDQFSSLGKALLSLTIRRQVKALGIASSGSCKAGRTLSQGTSSPVLFTGAMFTDSWWKLDQPAAALHATSCVLHNFLKLRIA